MKATYVFPHVLTSPAVYSGYGDPDKETMELRGPWLVSGARLKLISEGSNPRWYGTLCMTEGCFIAVALLVTCSSQRSGIKEMLFMCLDQLPSELFQLLGMVCF